MDWSQCPDVERRSGLVFGAFVVKGTRIQADAIVDNAKDGYTADEIATEIFPTVPADIARRVIDFALKREAHPGG